MEKHTEYNEFVRELQEIRSEIESRIAKGNIQNLDLVERLLEAQVSRYTTIEEKLDILANQSEQKIIALSQARNEINDSRESKSDKQR